MNSPHPQVAALLAGTLKPGDSAGPPTIEAVRTANEQLAELLAGPGEPVSRSWEASVQTSEGPVPVRWYVPTSSNNAGLLVYAHGGGFMAGSLNSYDTLCRALALRTSHVVISVAYSLSPESRYPRALREVVDVLKQARSLTREVGCPPRLAVAGDSAGGCLVAAALHTLAGSGAPLPDTAVLVYPVLDASMAHKSLRTLLTGYNLTTERVRWCWEEYLGIPYDLLEERVFDPEVSPLFSPHLERFPPVMVITAEFDPLRDEGAAFAARLSAARVRMLHLEAPGQIHGFLRFRRALTDPDWGPDSVMMRIGEFLSKPGINL